jgi:hypothetical protein
MSAQSIQNSLLWTAAVAMAGGGVGWTVSGILCWAGVPCVVAQFLASFSYFVSVLGQFADW